MNDRRLTTARTTQEPGHAATELHVRGENKSRGWLTARGAGFPAHATVRLDAPSALRQLKLLSHECKIASECHVYVTRLDGGGRRSVKRLGTLRFESNAECGYKARELKTVHVNVKDAVEVRLEFAGCHENSRNEGRQIGLMGLTLIGETMGEKPYRRMSGSGNEAAAERAPLLGHRAGGGASAGRGVDAVTEEKLREVIARKEHAVDAEDYDEAKRLRDVISRLREFGVKVKALQEEKMRAVEIEDYDEAKRLKIEIDRLRATGYEDAFGGSLSPSDSVARSMSGTTSVLSPPVVETRADIATTTQPPTTRKAFSFDEVPIRSKHADAMRELANEVDPQVSSPEPNAAVSHERKPSVASNSAQAPPPPRRPAPLVIEKPNSFREDDVSAAGMSNDEVPAVATGRRVPPELEAEAAAFFEEEEEEEKVQSVKKAAAASTNEDDAPPPPPLSPSEQVNAAPIIATFGEDVVMKLYSNAWMHRESALQSINKSLIDAWESEDASKVLGADPRETFQTLCKTLGDRLFNDKVANVTCAAAITLASAAKAFAAYVSARDVKDAVDDSISLLVDKLGDTNPRLRESIREALHAFAGDAPGGVSILAHALCKPVQKLSLWRVLTGRLTLMVELIPTYGLDAPRKDESFALEQVMKFASRCFDSANGEARGMAVKVVLACVDIVGSRVRNHLPRTLKSAIRDVIETAIDELEDPYNIRGRTGTTVRSPTASSAMWASATSPTSAAKRDDVGRSSFTSPTRARDHHGTTTAAAAVRSDISPELASSASALEREITRRIEMHGEHHPEVAAAMTDLATLYSESERFDRAQSLFERALAIQESVLGINHPETVQTLTDFAICHLDREDNARGRPLLERALDLQRALLGDDHPDVCAIRDVLASLDADF